MHELGGLPALHAQTSAIFSPDEQLIVTGTSADRNGVGGAILFVNAATGELVRTVAMKSSVVALAWHAGLNQIFAGIGALRVF